MAAAVYWLEASKPTSEGDHSGPAFMYCIILSSYVEAAAKVLGSIKTCIAGLKCLSTNIQLGRPLKLLYLDLLSGKLSSSMDSLLKTYMEHLARPIEKYMAWFEDARERRIRKEDIKLKVYPLKAKSDVFAIFQHYVAMVDNETGCKVHTLRTEQGGEYMSDAFEYFLGKKGIKHRCTMPYTPQQNGVAERIDGDC
ncbi:hypothetical protein L7F22_058724 [Adiantum nelumboides]|nr:hypothetical protein [Adiantum nelumboides]